MNLTKHLSRTLMLTSVVLVICVQCTKEKLEQETVEYPELHTAFVLDSKDFLKINQSQDYSLDGVFIKTVNGKPRFEGAIRNGKVLVNQALTTQPSFTKLLINESGTIQDYNSTLKNIQKFENFDFSYFPWSDLEIIVEHSDKIYLLTAELKYGISIHSSQEQETMTDQVFSTIKIEGDFKNFDETEAEPYSIVPMYSLGIPCPPYWREID